ncbi:MAG: hypothetical protein GX166_04535 [Clostridiaceae bacterium]|nr:hypothetical protein [Clostridiaceae bacterium]
MSRIKIVLISVIVLLIALMAACNDIKDIPKENNGTGNYPETFDLQRPVFSDVGGFYEKDFTLKIYFPDMYAVKGHNIYYTLDGSEPTAERGILYDSTKGVKIPGKLYTESNGDFVTVVRAAVFNIKGEMLGKISTATYIKTYDKDSRYSMPVISLVTEDKHLHNNRNGIFVNWQNKGREWERPVHVQFFEDDGTLGFSQDAGIRLFGGSSRGLPQKSLRISARDSGYFNTNKYDGAREFNYEIFPGRKKANGEVLTVYNSFILRNGGNDSLISGVEGYRATHLRDGWAARMAQIAAPNVDTMAYRPCVVYLNGGYYGILNIRERQDEDYIKNVYDIEDVENIAIISSELDVTRGGRYDGLWFYYVQDSGPGDQVRDFTNIGFDISNRWITYRELAEQFDIQNIIEFYAFNLFICNTDWPHNNVKVWRYVGPNKEEGTVRDGKWRFMFKDQDLGLSRYILASYDPGAPVELYTRADSKNFRFTLANFIKIQDHSGFPYVEWDKYSDSLITQRIFDFCLREDAFREQFREYCIKLATELLPPEVMLDVLDDIYKTVALEMRFHMFNRGKWEWTAHTDFDTWKNAVYGDDSLASFAKERSGKNGYFIKYMEEAMAWYDR